MFRLLIYLQVGARDYPVSTTVTMIQAILEMILMMMTKIIVTMMIISVEKRKQMIMGIHIIMTKTVVRSLALLEEILLNARMQKMKNNLREKMKILQKRIKALHLTPI